jgi:hypothetical protein
MHALNTRASPCRAHNLVMSWWPACGTQALAMGPACCAAYEPNLRPTGHCWCQDLSHIHCSNRQAAQCLQAWRYGHLISTTQPLQVV